MSKIKLIAAYLMTLLLSMIVVAIVASAFSGCTTQASMQSGEPYACYASRYLAREKQNSDKMVGECANSIKRDWCVKMLKENPDMFKDFNDCWRQ